jgi:hypothetical protein
MADDGVVVDNTVGDNVSNGYDGTGVGDVDGNSTIEGLAEGAQATTIRLLVEKLPTPCTLSEKWGVLLEWKTAKADANEHFDRYRCCQCNGDLRQMCLASPL